MCKWYFGANIILCFACTRFYICKIHVYEFICANPIFRSDLWKTNPRRKTHQYVCRWSRSSIRSHFLLLVWPASCGKITSKPNVGCSWQVESKPKLIQARPNKLSNLLFRPMYTLLVLLQSRAKPSSFTPIPNGPIVLFFIL